MPIRTFSSNVQFQRLKTIDHENSHSSGRSLSNDSGISIVNMYLDLGFYIDLGPQVSTEVGNSAGFLVASQSMQGDSCS